MELIPAIRARLERLKFQQRDERTSGRRAALWRAQQYAARTGRSIEDLRRYCLESLSQRRFLSEDDENDYLRGFRDGFQAVLRDIRTAEARRAHR